jgi:hypothetical protein
MAARRLGLQNLPLRQLLSRKAVSVCTTTRFLSIRRITKAGINELNDVFTRIGLSQNPHQRSPQEGVHEELYIITKRHGLEWNQVIRQFNKWILEETFRRSASEQQRVCLFSMSAQQRFYQALLRTSPREFLKSHTSKLHWNRIMGEIWGRAHFGKEIKQTILSLPKKNQLPWPDHLARLAFLVLEESRQIIANDLGSIFGDKRAAPLYTKTKCLDMTVLGIKKPKSRKTKQRTRTVLLRLETDLDQVDNDILRPGTLFGVPACKNDDKASIDNMVWGIMGGDPRRLAETGNRTFEMILPVSKTTFLEGTSLDIYGITSLLSQTRQFEACQHGLFLPFYLDLDDSANDDWHRDLHKPRFNTNRRLVKTPNGPVVVHRNVPNKKKGNHQAGGNTGEEESELSLSTVKQGKTRMVQKNRN